MSGQVYAMNPMLIDWYDPSKEGIALYKTLLLDPKDRKQVASLIERKSPPRCAPLCPPYSPHATVTRLPLANGRMTEETTWWSFCGIPSEPRKATQVTHALCACW